MGAVYKREIRSYLTTFPMYIFAAVFLLACGMAFTLTVLQPANETQTFSLESYFLVVIIVTALTLPVLTMKLFSEDKKLKTEQLLLTSPISITEMVLGKFFAAYTVYVVCALISSTQLFVVSKYAVSFNGGIALGSVITLLLLGAAFIAMGVFFSSLTENQMVAALCSFIVQALFVFASFFNSAIDNAFFRNILSFFSVYSRFSQFTSGRFDFAALFYYISLTFLFLFFTTRVYTRRRYA